ncbi:dephospho-CoA kinase [Paraferrimonas sp. SM1919]|uniref:dephospho-CoA kinase n=1 Tax=Paraferrimonas sp. SM1919 TaxID=2662263 RepID=UPI0013CF432F|nr:dephospho-CoA kinase [Paraferrimonas sp. SM1919]
MDKLFIGLTGGIGSGKSTVAQLFRSLGVTVIDADQVAREVVAKGSPGLKAIASHFGEVVINNGELDRTRLRDIIFNDAQQRTWLNNLLHPMIRHSMLVQAQASSSNYVIFEVPLLFENGFSQITQINIVVDCDEQTQLHRATLRDGSTDEQIQKIINTQMPRQQKLELADDVIYNNKDLPHLEQQVWQLHSKYMQLSQA